MPKINVYLPDELAEQVKEVGVPVSAVCQRALEQAVRRIGSIRAIRLDDPASQDAAARQSRFTDRVRTVLRLAADRARADGSATVGTEHLLVGVLEEGGNLALRVLRAMEVDPDRITLPEQPAGDATPTAFSPSAAVALELGVTEAITLGHNYVGCEHLLIGLAAEPDGTAGNVLRALGVDPRSARQAVVAALSGFAHFQAASTPADPTAVITAVVRKELQPVVERIERLERRA
ncbi:Clp protease N-terminal domain-containing protein [Saccharothrix deserti]|uniref:Clp protease N-terminal domain-containing protein n=1 Tax=Saccharothrix deserti TaxID=2593674 RepID=UPI00131CCEC2|nr:Clp protease N-terminal domain-containing protein [Saccharothrix deserti]